MIRLHLAVLALGCVAVTLAFPGAAVADTVIPAGHSVTEVTVFGEDVTLDGTSRGSVIVVDGNLTIGPHGRARHGVTVVGGQLVSALGGQIQGDVVQLAGPIPHPSGWLLAGAGVALLAARLVVVWLLVRIAGLLDGWPTTGVMLAAARRRPIRSSIVGALLTSGLLAACILLAVSVVGLIFAAALSGVLLLAAGLGVAFARSGVRDDARHTSTITVVLAIPLVGDAMLALGSIVALGAAFHYVIDERGSQPLPVLTDP